LVRLFRGKEGGKDRQRRAIGNALEGGELRGREVGCDTTPAAAAVAAAAAASHMLVLVRSAGVVIWCTWHVEGAVRRQQKHTLCTHTHHHN
jgi:hypothetical protein